MAKAFTTEVTYPDGKVRRFTSEIGGGDMTAEQLQRHYDDWAAKGLGLHPFPGATSWRVVPESEADIGGRTGYEKTPPVIPAQPAEPRSEPAQS